MGKNTGRGFRLGAVRGRSQIFNPFSGWWIKRDKSGKLMKSKKSGSPWKGVRMKR